MTAQGMNHFTILAEDLGATVRFYTEFLGLKDGYRPDLGFPGAWMYAQAPTDHTGQAVLHIIAGRPMPNPRSGVIDHMAYTAKGMAATVAKLEAHGRQICEAQAGRPCRHLAGVLLRSQRRRVSNSTSRRPKATELQFFFAKRPSSAIRGPAGRLRTSPSAIRRLNG